ESRDCRFAFHPMTAAAAGWLLAALGGFRSPAVPTGSGVPVPTPPGETAGLRLAPAGTRAAPGECAGAIQGFALPAPAWQAPYRAAPMGSGAQAEAHRRSWPSRRTAD